jgi:hypothetical protein
VPGIGVRDLRPHQDDLRSVVDPGQHDDDRGGRTVRRLQSLLADVEAYPAFPTSKNKAVRSAPGQTSRQPMETSGSHLNIIANSTVTTRTGTNTDRGATPKPSRAET